jgi:hypothetical protein
MTIPGSFWKPLTFMTRRVTTKHEIPPAPLWQRGEFGGISCEECTMSGRVMTMNGFLRHLVIWIVVLGFPLSPGSTEMPTAPSAPPLPILSEVAVSPKLFNPTTGETATISFSITQPAKISLRIFDPDHHLLREIMSEGSATLEPQKLVWDGKDAQGRVVPDEAYFFTIEAFNHQGLIAHYDPTTFSGGEVVRADGVNFDKDKKTIFYELPGDARVAIKAGISGGGPLLKNILSGLPRAAGRHEESWDGRDESGIVEVPAERNYSLNVEAVSLFENSLITTGNSAYDYFRYSRDIAPERPRKIARPFRGHEAAFAGLPPKDPSPLVPEPKFRIEWPDETPRTEENVPIVSDRAAIRIRLDDKIKTTITEQRYEIILFVDFRFVTEMEEGYSPFNLKWNTRETANGEHLITINVATLSGQVSSASTRLTVRNAPQPSNF